MSPDGEAPETPGPDQGLLTQESSTGEQQNRRLNSERTGQGAAERRDRRSHRVRTLKPERQTRAKHTGVGKGSKLFPENKGSCLQLAAGDRARLRSGQLSRKEGGATSTKSPATPPAAITPVAITSLHCRPEPQGVLCMSFCMKLMSGVQCGTHLCLRV